MELIKFENFCFSYEPDSELILNNLNLSAYEGEISVICGASSSGKTTLLRNIKKEIAPSGSVAGNVILNINSSDIGIVFQNINTQIISNSVLHNLVFHMENIGLDNIVMRKRISETVGFLGLEQILHKNASELSGGQKQMIALAAELMLQPKLLLLDEPLSQLDPISAYNFITMLRKVNEETGLTIIMTEHNIDNLISFADKILFIKNGKFIYEGTPKNVIKKIWLNKDINTTSFIPAIPVCSLTLDETEPICLTPKELKKRIRKTGFKISDTNIKIEKRKKEIIVKNLSFKYEEVFFYIIKNLSLNIYEGEFISILGGNGSGKTTLLRILLKILKPASGSVKITDKKIAYIPQNISAYFHYDTAEKELTKNINLKQEHVNEIMKSLNLTSIFKKHPYDLSGGEQQKLAIGAALISAPEIIVMDEPTKGIDPNLKKVVLELLLKSNATIIIATHDIEFAANASDRCLMLFNGDIAVDAAPREFFKSNKFYTTEVNKAFSSIDPDVIYYKDVLEICQKEKPSFIQL